MIRQGNIGDAKEGEVARALLVRQIVQPKGFIYEGKVFVADYESAMFALDAKTGKPVWRTNTTKVPPFGSGGFFSSPAIAFGRVYAARDDGTVFAFDEKTGKVAWSFPTDNFVYGSPAVAQVPGTPPTVYIGSEDGHFYALDARTGKQRWRYDVGGPVPGTATVIGHTVYTSSFKTARNDRHRRPHPPQDLRAEPGRLHAGRLRRQPPLPDRLLRADRARTELALRRRCSGRRGRQRPRRPCPTLLLQRPEPDPTCVVRVAFGAPEATLAALTLKRSVPFRSPETLSTVKVVLLDFVTVSLPGLREATARSACLCRRAAAR